MLSTPLTNSAPSALQTRQRIHRRQRSTPSAFEGLKITSSNMPAVSASPATAAAAAANTAMQQAQRQQPNRNMGHRRGLSLDTRRQQLQQRQQRQQQLQSHAAQQQALMAAAAASAATTPSAPAADDFNGNSSTAMVSNTTNTTTTTQQQPQHQQQTHVLRETQQPRTARPGVSGHRRQTSYVNQSHAAEDAASMLLASPQGTTMMNHAQQFDIAGVNGGNGNGANMLAARQAAAQQTQQDCVSGSPYDFNGHTAAAAAMMRKTLSAGGCSGSAMPMQQQDFHQGFQQEFQQVQQDFQLYGSPDEINRPLSPNTFMNMQMAAANGAATVAMGANANNNGSAQGWTSEDETSSTRRTHRRISNGIMDRVVKFEQIANLDGMDGMSKPTTPAHQNENTYFPPTPKETPQERMASSKGGARLDRFADDYDESMEETIKVSRGAGHRHSRSNRTSGIFDDLRQQAEMAAANAAYTTAAATSMGSTPPRPSMMQMPMTPVDFMNMSNVNAEFLKIQAGNYAAAGLQIPTDMQHLSPPVSQLPTPATVQGVFDNTAIGTGISPFANKPDLWPTSNAGEYDSAMSAVAAVMAPFPSGAHGASSPPHSDGTPSRRRSPHRRNESMASIVSAASIASINIEETRTETGVTLDDIATYIEGPSPTDGKWRCTFDGCGKRFGRKENIKSHVQTHLNDRQYQCPHCQKCFVRQHDLKRHAKIHTGIKPYPCECGNNFARHDALTRHRQRGMCIGAFDGAVRKVGKRGRPRKNRPDMDTRREKSTRTRSKNNKSANTETNGFLPSSPEASSQSGYSDSSAANSPHTDDSDANPFDDDAPFDAGMEDDLLDMGLVNMNSLSAATMSPSILAVSSAPMPGAGISAEEMVKIMPVVSPSEHAAALAASPSAMSHYSQTSHASHISHASHASNASQGCGSVYCQDEACGESGASGATITEATAAEDMLPSSVAIPASPAKSVASHFSHHPCTPPELSASSSPPHSTSRYFELDPNSSCTEEDSIGMGAPLTETSTNNGCGLDVGSLSSGSLDDDIMLMKAFTTDDVLVQLDNSGLSMLNTSKFDDEYGMFTNSDDVFFGN